MSDDFEFMSQNDDPAADFLARESKELGEELGEELGISHPPPIFVVEQNPIENGHFEDQIDNHASVFGSRYYLKKRFFKLETITL
jgi:hypothetical protein